MRKRKMWVGYLFILPSFVGVLIFVLIPYIDVVRRAFMQTASGQFVGLLNFKAILQNKAFLLAFTNAGRFVGGLYSYFACLIIRNCGVPRKTDCVCGNFKNWIFSTDGNTGCFRCDFMAVFV